MSARKMTELQYQLLASRRQNHDTMVWQTPVISLTAQAFLFTIALGAGPVFSRILACILALTSALASMHLLAKQRHFEVSFSLRLEAYERAKRLAAIHAPLSKARGPVGWSAYVVWMCVFATFACAAVAVAGVALFQHMRPT